MGLIQDLEKSIDENKSHIASGGVLPDDKCSMQIDNANARAFIEALRGIFKYTPTENGLPRGVKHEDVIFQGFYEDFDALLVKTESRMECYFYADGGWGQSRDFHKRLELILDAIGISHKKGDAQ